MPQLQSSGPRFVAAVTGVATNLASVAATGLAVVMVGAAIVMIRRREFGRIAVNLLYFALTVFVAWGRSRSAEAGTRDGPPRAAGRSQRHVRQPRLLDQLPGDPHIQISAAAGDWSTLDS